MDPINAYFQRFYPEEIDRSLFRFCDMVMGEEYNHPDDEIRGKRIFPSIECADGFTMSVQGHYSAYSRPRDDFADMYQQFEVLCPAEPLIEEYRADNLGKHGVNHAYVPLEDVLAVIEKHGGAPCLDPTRQNTGGRS